MLMFIYTFVVVFMAILLILGIGAILNNDSLETKKVVEGKLTAAMCTTKLLDTGYNKDSGTLDDFVIEQDMVYTFDSLNLEMELEDL